MEDEGWVGGSMGGRGLGDVGAEQGGGGLEGLVVWDLEGAAFLEGGWSTPSLEEFLFLLLAAGSPDCAFSCEGWRPFRNVKTCFMVLEFCLTSFSSVLMSFLRREMDSDSWAMVIFLLKEWIRRDIHRNSMGATFLMLGSQKHLLSFLSLASWQKSSKVLWISCWSSSSRASESCSHFSMTPIDGNVVMWGHLDMV